MRVVAFIALSVFNLVVLAGASAVVIAAGPRGHGPLLLLLVTAGTVLVTGVPLVLGSLQAWWDPELSDGARKTYRRRLGVTVGTQGVGVALVVVWTVLVGAEWWAAPVLAVAGAGLDALAMLLGPRIRAWNLRTAPEPPRTVGSGIPRSEITTRIRRMVIAFLVSLAVSVAAFAALYVVTGSSASWLEVISSALGAAFMVTGLVAILGTSAWSRELRSIAGGDLGVIRRCVRVVIRGKRNVIVDESERPTMSRYAATAAVLLPFQLAYVVLLYAGTGLLQVPQLVTHPDRPTTWTICGLLAVAAAILVPLLLVYIRRARRYAEEHAADLGAS